MVNVGICDDGKNICADIENILLNYSCEKNIQLDINVWYTGEELMRYLKSGGKVDVLFLDIELYCMSGIEVGEFIRNRLDNLGMQIIYISGKASYALQLFKTQPLDFLVKPITVKEIYDVVDKAISIIVKKNEKFEFQNGKEYYYVPMGDIIFFTSDKRKVRIETQNGVFEFYGKLKDVVNRLPDEFIMIHQSFAVNKEYIFRYTYENVELINGTILPISPINRKTVREKILKEV